MDNQQIIKKKRKRKKKKTTVSPWKSLVSDNVTRFEWEDYELDQTLAFSARFCQTKNGKNASVVNIDKPKLTSDIVREYVFHHITHNWGFVKEFLRKDFFSKSPKGKKKSNNGDRIRHLLVATSGIYDSMWRRARRILKYWTFLIVRIERDPSCVYIFFSDKDTGVWYNHRLHVDPTNTDHVKNYESPKRNTLKFCAKSRILEKISDPSILIDDYELDIRTITGNTDGKPTVYQFHRWEDGLHYGSGQLSTFKHFPINDCSLFDVEMKRHMKKHIYKEWKILFVAYFKKMKMYKDKIIQSIFQYSCLLQKDQKNEKYIRILNQLKHTSDYFAMHFLIPIPTDNIDAFPFVDDKINFISMVWFTPLNVGMDKTIFWHMSTSEDTVYNEVRHILDDYTSTPFNILWGEDNVDPMKDIYFACGYPQLDADEIVWEYRDINGHMVGYGSVSKFKAEIMNHIYKARELDNEIIKEQKKGVLEEALTRSNRNPKFDIDYRDFVNDKVKQLETNQYELELRHECELIERSVEILKNNDGKMVVII
jgi:hypothetical protein